MVRMEEDITAGIASQVDPGIFPIQKRSRDARPADRTESGSIMVAGAVPGQALYDEIHARIVHILSLRENDRSISAERPACSVPDGTEWPVWFSCGKKVEIHN